MPLPLVKADGDWKGAAADGGPRRYRWRKRTAWGGRCRGRRSLPLPVLTADGVGRALKHSDGKISTSGAGGIARLDLGVGENLLGRLVVRRELR